MVVLDRSYIRLIAATPCSSVQGAIPYRANRREAAATIPKLGRKTALKIVASATKDGPIELLDHRWDLDYEVFAIGGHLFQKGWHRDAVVLAGHNGQHACPGSADSSTKKISAADTQPIANAAG